MKETSFVIVDNMIFTISNGTWEVSMDRETFLAALEIYALACNILPKHAESLHSDERDTRQSVL